MRPASPGAVMNGGRLPRGAPEVYGLPPDPVDVTRNLRTTWSAAAVASVGLGVGLAVAVFGGRR